MAGRIDWQYYSNRTCGLLFDEHLKLQKAKRIRFQEPSRMFGHAEMQAARETYLEGMRREEIKRKHGNHEKNTIEFQCTC